MHSAKIEFIKEHISHMSSTITARRKNSLRKMSKQRNSNKQLVGAEKPMGVFLYLQPKAIMYPKEDNALINIVMEHPLGPITRLSNKYKPENVINVNKFDSEKPTFSITIKQDGLADVEECIDSPLILTLYEQEIRDDISETSTESRPPHKYQGRAIAQGHMDLIQYFTKKRIMLNVNVFLYPLNPREDDVTCKMVWDVYSLMPLLKTVNFSNILFITLTSIYNIDGSFLDDYQNLASTFWLRINSWSERESNDKIFICKYTGFSKQIIIEQTKYYKWENMKNAEYNNYNSMAILSGSSFNIHKIFNNLFCTENFNFNFWDVDMNNDYCLVCNSLHRFVLTDKMQTVLEQHLACGRSEIVVDIFDDSQPTNILLQGVIDLSIFMYPKITECSFAVDLNPPIELTRSSALSSPVSSGRKRSQSPQLPKHKQSEKDVGKPIFAVVKICVQVPITDPPQDANVLFNNIDPINIDMTRDVYQSCGAAKIRDSLFPTGEAQCVRSYQEFDDNVLKLRENITAGNLFPTDKDDKEKLCQTPDMSNRILSLIACDFNVRYPTNTNRDFVQSGGKNVHERLTFVVGTGKNHIAIFVFRLELVNLMTNVYRELVDRSYRLINSCEESLTNTTITYSKVQSILVNHISLAKYMRAIGNWDIYQCLVNKLKDQFSTSSMLRFYGFLYDLELEDYDSARDYIQMPLSEQDMEGQLFTNICKLYLDYIRDKNDSDINDNLEIDLLKALRNLCEMQQPTLPVSWMLLYCIYKKHNYQPGTSYSRWRYESLIRKGKFFQIEHLPRSNWEIFNDFEPLIKTENAKNLWKGIKLLLRLGLYNFAQVIYDEIADEFSALERYILGANFQLFTNQLENFVPIKKFPTDKLKNGSELNAFINLTNGNIEYFRNPNDSAWIRYYASILDTENVEDTFHFQLGTLRYAAKMMEQKEYESAIRALDYASDNYNHGLFKSVAKAKALYYLGRLKEAERYLAEGTNYDLFLPNVWAGLALINLRLGENYKALECWIYARLNPDYAIDEEILDELRKIDHDNVKLYVDIPNSS